MFRYGQTPWHYTITIRIVMLELHYHLVYFYCDLPW
jgi:hypothetical protein